jgi:hypothetical protein
MFRTVFSPLFIAAIAISLFGAVQLSGQVPEHDLPAIKERAVSNFEAGAYAAAMPDFMKLIRQFPRDPLYRYYAGICKVELNRDLEEAAELLYFASSRGVPKDVYFYLGEAYRKMYDFEKARRNFIEFDKVAPRRMSKEKNSKLLISSATSAIQLTSMYNPFDVKSVTFLNFSDSEQYSQIRMKGGALAVKPDVFFADKEDRSDLNALMFMPEKTVRGQVVYFSGLERSGKNGFQIMQARKNAAGKWVDIQTVDALNTELDELLPYYDPVGRDIYFASNGREGLGGFDLYRSHFDEDRGEWSDPVHLGFPVNSAFDDYLLLPGTDLGKVIFFSARQSSDTAVAVYSVHLSEPKQSLASHTPQKIRSIANLGDVAIQARKDYDTYRELMAGTGGSQEPSAAADIPGEKPGAHEVKSADAEESRAGSEYQQLISAALKHQSASDSLVELAIAARVKVRDSNDPNDRWMHQKQIMVWEKRAAEEKAFADELFARVAGYEAAVDPAAVPEVIEKDTVINELTVYRFAQTGQIGDRAKEVFQSAPNETGDPEKSAAPNENAPSNEQSPGKVNPAARNRLSAVGSDRTDASPSNPKTAPTDQESALTGQWLSDAIPVDIAIPRGTFYRIQLGVFSKKVGKDAFGDLSPITAEILPGRNLTKYYAGSFDRYEDARRLLPDVRSAGFSDAFIVAWYNGNVMSVEKARKLEDTTP